MRIKIISDLALATSFHASAFAYAGQNLEGNLHRDMLFQAENQSSNAMIIKVGSGRKSPEECKAHAKVICDKNISYNYSSLKYEQCMNKYFLDCTWTE